METIQKIMNGKDESRLRSLLFDNEDTNRRIAIKDSEKSIQTKRRDDLDKKPRTIQETIFLKF